MQFGAQLVNYFCEWDDTLATVKAVQAGRWHSLGGRTTSCRRWGGRTWSTSGPWKAGRC